MSKRSSHSISPSESAEPDPVEHPGQTAGPSDDGLISGCIAGEQSAWRELVHRYAGLVYSVPARLGLDDASSDDVFQMVFEVLLKQLPRLRDRQSLPKWLLTAAQRISWKVIRQQRKEQSAVVAEQASDPTEVLIKCERQHRVRQALARLGGRCQALLTALYLGQNQPNYGQVAQMLGLPLGSIGPTRARCIEKMIELLEGGSGDGNRRSD